MLILQIRNCKFINEEIKILHIHVCEFLAFINVYLIVCIFNYFNIQNQRNFIHRNIHALYATCYVIFQYVLCNITLTLINFNRFLFKNY
jgi:hypothetical protein